ncbi:zinc finger CCCH domain-containing protein 3 [Centropristis striata]|uniref:zinc finger CCCH domain-containing protein 3 n=1 Tax=Centropristis striata TaxID=184440 RepID=UPI0027DFE671|nr:zinc finger CCCH domain-containing protein 3 [Centropristis striata]
MAEREALQRQIELLQNLINKHKSLHGDAPFTREEPGPGAAPARGPGAAPARGPGAAPARGPGAAPARGPGAAPARGPGAAPARGPGAAPARGPGAAPARGLGSVRAAPSRGGWRKTYSLSNSQARAPAARPPASSTVHQPHTSAPSTSAPSNLAPCTLAPSTSAPSSSAPSTSAPSTSAPSRSGPSSSAPSSSAPSSSAPSTSAPSSHSRGEESHGASSSSGAPPPQREGPQLRTETRTRVRGSSVKGGSSGPSPRTRTSSESRGPVSASFLKKSKFTWVKSQSVGAGPKLSSPAPSPRGTSSSSPRGSSSSPLSSMRRTPAKKTVRRLSSVSPASRTSRYRWVSSSSSSSGAKTPRRPPAPSQRAQEKGGEGPRRLRVASTPSPKIKKGSGSGSGSGSSLSSRYRWKAGGQVTVATGRRSAFTWTPGGVKGGLAVPPSGASSSSSSSSSSPAGFKLRSRMKIIRRSVSSPAGPERGAGGPARGRGHSWPLRRTPSRELVSFGRHKLRRLAGPASCSPRGPASCSPRGPASSQRVFRTRYKMVTRPGSTHYSPAQTWTQTWRTRRIQSARSFLQSRLRAPPHRPPPAPRQPWRGSSMCWIRGSLYRVSANKLSRTAASSMAINRTGVVRSVGSAHLSTSPAHLRPSSSRHLASRAVQRSLAIIRQARHKKQQKQFCMYYNRFGRCNRGNSCPFIHDPDKVAVCTRFLRGTCKQADGTCPFSHKVAKEKMPVCSYFLKGICNNSECPYSHVYVSRKAEVCEDFIRGYCPQGEKCKKKHTLVCPDFSKTGSCPRASRCKLQHRQRAGPGAGPGARAGAGPGAGPGARPGARPGAGPGASRSSRSSSPTRRAKRPRLSVAMTTPCGPLALPSFISLSSSPEEADTPDTLPDLTAQVKEKKLQIKPRL